MLYDILPPLIFFASLGGVIVVMARVSMRARRQVTATMIAQAREAIVAAPEHILRPAQRSVQAIGSRLGMARRGGKKVTGLFIQWLGKLRSVRLPKFPKLPKLPKLPRQTSPAPAKAEPKVTVITREIPSPTPVPVMKVRTAKPISVLDQANAAIAAAAWEQAEELLVAYIVDHTKDARAYMLLGQVAAGQRNWPEAMEIFEQVTRIDSQEPGAWAALGEAAFACGKFTKALEALQRAHNVDRENVVVLRHLLTIAQRMDNRVLQQSVAQELAVLEREQVPAK